MTFSTSDYGKALDAAIEPIAAAYGVEIQRHYHAGYGCRCGWTPKRQTKHHRVATGVHVKMAMTKASKTYDREVEAVIATISAEFDAREEAGRS